MPRLEYSERFASDLAEVTSERVEARVLTALDNIEAFGDFGSPVVPSSLTERFGNGIRKVAIAPFDLLYTHYPSQDLARIEAFVYARRVS